MSYVILQDVVEEHKRTLKPGHIRDFIDAFLLEMENTSNSDDEEVPFNGKFHLKLHIGLNPHVIDKLMISLLFYRRAVDGIAVGHVHGGVGHNQQHYEFCDTVSAASPGDPSHGSARDGYQQASHAAG